MFKKTKALLVSSPHLPNPTGNGNCVLLNGLVSCMLQLDIAVTVLPYRLQYTRSGEAEKHLNELSARPGVTILEIPNLVTPPPAGNYFSKLKDIVLKKANINPLSASGLAAIQDYIEREEIAFVIGYDWYSLDILSQIKSVPTIISLVDLMEDIYEIRLKNMRFWDITTVGLRKKYNLRLVKEQVNYYGAGLKKINAIIEHADLHVRHLEQKGYKNIRYIPHPLTQKTITYGKPHNKSDKEVVVLIIGSLKGETSKLGFLYFINDLYPLLKAREAEWTAPVRFRIVGHGEIDSTIKAQLLAIPEVDFGGFAENVEDEYAKADIVLVTIPINLGFRTRIAESFSYGLCTVAHAANAQGMPEIQNNQNAISEDEPKRLADGLLRVIAQPDLRYTLGQGGLKTFIEQISIEAAVPKIAERIDTAKQQFLLNLTTQNT